MTNNANKKPQNFDWVSARSQCSVKQMFEELKLGVKQDVEAMSKAIKSDPTRNPANIFKIAENAKTMKVFFDDPFSDGPSVLFTLTRSAIRVSDGETNEFLFNLEIGLNEEGDCRFTMEGKEFDSWQVRRKSLEGLFFKDSKAE